MYVPSFIDVGRAVSEPFGSEDVDTPATRTGGPTLTEITSLI